MRINIIAPGILYKKLYMMISTEPPPCGLVWLFPGLGFASAFGVSRLRVQTGVQGLPSCLSVDIKKGFQLRRSRFPGLGFRPAFRICLPAFSRALVRSPSPASTGLFFFPRASHAQTFSILVGLETYYGGGLG